MLDKVEIKLSGVLLTEFESYFIESDIYNAADAFRLELRQHSIEIKPGTRCEIFVNDTLEMTGIVDRISRDYDKGSINLTLEGRDLMGPVVDSCVEEFIDLENITLKTLAEYLLKKVPFINRKGIEYSKGHKAKDSEDRQMRAEPGDTVFEVLRRFALSRGLLFFSMPDGRMLFGKPTEKGDIEFHLICRESGESNNTMQGRMTEDISQRYSKVTVLGQRQGHDELSVDQVNILATATDKDFPFYKPFVTTMNHDAESPLRLAKLTLERQRFEGFVLEYTVSGHSQGGKNFTVNSLCRVEDEVLGVNGVYLIYARTFEGGRKGFTTRLRLGLPGVIQ